MFSNVITTFFPPKNGEILWKLYNLLKFDYTKNDKQKEKTSSTGLNLENAAVFEISKIFITVHTLSFVVF